MQKITLLSSLRDKIIKNHYSLDRRFNYFGILLEKSSLHFPQFSLLLLLSVTFSREFDVLYLFMRQIVPYFAQVEKAFSLRHIDKEIRS